MVPMVLMMGLGPLARWKKFSVPELARHVRWAFVSAVLLAVLLPLAMGKWTAYDRAGPVDGVLDYYSMISSLRERLVGHGNFMQRLRGPVAELLRHAVGASWCGVFIIGVTLVKGYETERDVRMDVGDTLEGRRLRIPF